MGSKSSKIINENDAAKDSNEEVSTKSNEEVRNINQKNQTGFIGSKVPEFEKDVYLPKTDVVGILKREDLEGVFSVLYFFAGDFDPGVLPEISELKKMTSSPDNARTSNYNLLAVSTDSIDAHKAFSQLEQSQGGLKDIDVVLISDKTGELCKMFQIYDESSHSAYPSYVILDADVNVVSKITFDPSVRGDVNSVFNVLRYLMNEDAAKRDDSKGSFGVDTHSNSIIWTKDDVLATLRFEGLTDEELAICFDEACSRNGKVDITQFREKVRRIEK